MDQGLHQGFLEEKGKQSAIVSSNAWQCKKASVAAPLTGSSLRISQEISIHSAHFAPWRDSPVSVLVPFLQVVFVGRNLEVK